MLLYLFHYLWPIVATLGPWSTSRTQSGSLKNHRFCKNKRFTYYKAKIELSLFMFERRFFSLWRPISDWFLFSLLTSLDRKTCYPWVMPLYKTLCGFKDKSCHLSLSCQKQMKMRLIHYDFVYSILFHWDLDTQYIFFVLFRYLNAFCKK